VQQIFPTPLGDFELQQLTSSPDRRPTPDRPWVMANMVGSIDGGFAVGGRSGPLGGPADKLVFHALRAASDAILVAAGTARTERYGRPAVHSAPGSVVAPRLVIVSRSLRIPPDQPFLQGDGPEPLVFHPQDADTGSVPAGVTLRATGTGEVDLASAMRSLRDDGIEQLLCEGGPNLLGQLFRANLVDELFLTVSPVLTGGSDVGLIGPTSLGVASMALHRVLEQDGFLFLTYRWAD
jgi:riboflavin biosynthesis pyrimidine reductase